MNWMNSVHSPQVFCKGSFQTLMLFKCTLKKYAEEFCSGNLYWGTPKSWIDIAKSGSKGQGDSLEGTYASVVPLVNPKLYSVLKSEPSVTQFSENGYVFRNSIVVAYCNGQEIAKKKAMIFTSGEMIVLRVNSSVINELGDGVITVSIEGEKQ